MSTRREQITSKATEHASSVTVVPLTPATEPRRPLGRAVQAVTRPVAVVWPRPTVDEWGRDTRFVEALQPFARLRWDVTVGGQQHIGGGAALVLISTRRLAMTAVYVSWAIGDVLGRPVRFAGRPDTVPFGPWMRRAGGILAHPGEIASALRAGEIVVVGASATSNPRQAGTVDPTLIEPALREHVPVHVAATMNTMIGRQARVEIAPRLLPKRARRGPLAEVELAEQAQRAMQDLLDELGGNRTGLGVLGWIAEG